MPVRIALLLLLGLWTPTWGACAPLGKLCTPPGAPGNNPACCAGLECPAEGTSKNHCVAATGATSTTPPPTTPHPTTTVVSGPHPTTTVPPFPPSSSGPVRFTATDVGLRFPDSQEILWNPKTGMPVNQYEMMVRLSVLHWELMPNLLRLMRDTPACGVGSGLGGTIRDMVGKFFILYSLRPLRDGGVYDFHPNYLWDLPQNILRKAKGCIPASQWGALAPLFATGPPPPAHREDADRSHVGDGQLDARTKYAPLTPVQCELLHRAHDAHQNHGDVFGTQRAFETSARSVDELTLFTLVFTGSIDPKASPARVAALTTETETFHEAWMQCFHCDTGAPPDLTCAWGAALGHARAHFLRAVTFPGLVLREVCPGDIHYCPQTDH